MEQGARSGEVQTYWNAPGSTHKRAGLNRRTTVSTSSASAGSICQRASSSPHLCVSVFDDAQLRTCYLLDFVSNNADAVKWQVWTTLIVPLPNSEPSRVGGQLPAALPLCPRGSLALTRTRRCVQILRDGALCMIAIDCPRPAHSP